MDKFRVERKRFYNELEQISGIRVIPSQANYFMIEITNGMTAKELMIKLFKNHYLLIKDLTSKVHDGKQYIRIAIRNDADNNKMLEALKRNLIKTEIKSMLTLLNLNVAGYIDPSVMTYAIQAIAGVIIAVGAFLGIYLRKAKKSLITSLALMKTETRKLRQMISLLTNQNNK